MDPAPPQAAALIVDRAAEQRDGDDPAAAAEAEVDEAGAVGAGAGSAAVVTSPASEPAPFAVDGGDGSPRAPAGGASDPPPPSPDAAAPPGPPTHHPLALPVANAGAVAAAPAEEEAPPPSLAGAGAGASPPVAAADDEDESEEEGHPMTEVVPGEGHPDGGNVADPVGGEREKNPAEPSGDEVEDLEAGDSNGEVEEEDEEDDGRPLSNPVDEEMEDEQAGDKYGDQEGQDVRARDEVESPMEEDPSSQPSPDDENGEEEAGDESPEDEEEDEPEDYPEDDDGAEDEEGNAEDRAEQEVTEGDGEGAEVARSHDDEQAAEEEPEDRDDKVDETGEDEDMVEGEGEEELDAAMEEAEEGPVEAEAAAPEASYSTRGRTVDAMDPLERLAREALGESTAASKEKERESFLSDAITEEERRTRTRYIPAVEGMHQLRKQEIKSDLTLARNAGVATSWGMAKPKARRGNNMEVDGDEATSVDEERSDILRLGTKTVDIGSTAIVIPSLAFVAPPAPSDATKSTTTSSTPREVEAVTAFNPPRPPESVGPKKKHRMLRWERRPTDIEVDLNNYRKTVHRTRDELRRAEEERERLETVDNHLRRHFLLHLDAIGKEWTRLNKELAAVQQECVNSADLLTSRTRSRGAGKNSYAMRDVLTVLRTRGQELDAKGLVVPPYEGQTTTSSSGLGGVNWISFQDWDRATDIAPAAIASCWILPGDLVATPYGDGQVVAVLDAEPVDTTKEPQKELAFQGTVSETIEDPTNAEPSNTSPKSKDGKSDGPTGPAAGFESTILVAPRVAVRLPFGVGFFPPEIVMTKEDPSSFSDTRLALRWKGILETAVNMGGYLDVAAMSEPDSVYHETHGLAGEDEGASKDDDMGEEQRRLLPFGSRMLPTSNGRGAGLWNLRPELLDESIDNTLLQGCVVLGTVDNDGVPVVIRKMEDDNQDEIGLRAKVLQLRNELYRQRRVRMLNERTLASTKERAARVETLVAEMRTDLKTLKRRLDEEVAELGISENEAEAIVTAYYKSLYSQDSGEASPQKRSRRMSRLDTEDEEMEDEEEGVPASSTQMEMAAAT